IAQIELFCHNQSRWSSDHRKSIRYTRRRALSRPKVKPLGLQYFTAMNKRIAVLMDGGHVRSYARKAKKSFVPDYIEKIAHASALADEVIHRILYYDCPPYTGEAVLPVSGVKKAFSGSDKWLHDLSRKDLFAIRTGVLK